MNGVTKKRRFVILSAWEIEARAVLNRGRGSKLWMKNKSRARNEMPMMGLTEERPYDFVTTEMFHPFGAASLLEGARPSSVTVILAIISRVNQRQETIGERFQMGDFHRKQHKTPSPNNNGSYSNTRRRETDQD